MGAYGHSRISEMILGGATKSVLKGMKCPGAFFALMRHNGLLHDLRIEKGTMAIADHEAIEVRVDDIAQLFDTLDPYPFPERDLNRDAEDYIVGWARELALHRPIAIAIHYPDTAHQRAPFAPSNRQW